MTSTKFIAGDGTGNYNCDGSDDQEVINSALSWAALNPGNRVHLVGNFEYQITNQIFIGSDTIFSGDATAVLKVADMACGTSVDNCVFPDGTTVMAPIKGTVPKNVEICGFTFDGNCQNQALNLGYAHGKPASAGSGVERLIGLRGIAGGTKASNISIHNMTFRDSFGEAAHILYAENVSVFNNIAENHQHDAFFFIEVNGENVLRNNIIYGITDGCARWDNCANWKIYENRFLAYTGDHNNTAMKLGQNGIQIANESNKPSVTSNMEVYNNEFIGPNLCGIWLNDTLKKAGTTPQEVWIHNNNFENCAWRDTSTWSAAISIAPWGNGVKIDHNTFDSCYNNSVQFNSAIATGCSAEVSYNNFVNTKGSRTNSTTGPSVVGYGLLNISGMNVVADCNYMSGNAAGDYYKVTPGSLSAEFLEDSTIDIESNKDAVDVIVTCLETEVSKFVEGLTQNYRIYDKV